MYLFLQANYHWRVSIWMLMLHKPFKIRLIYTVLWLNGSASEPFPLGIIIMAWVLFI